MLEPLRLTLHHAPFAIYFRIVVLLVVIYEDIARMGTVAFIIHHLAAPCPSVTFGHAYATLCPP